MKTKLRTYVFILIVIVVSIFTIWNIISSESDFQTYHNTFANMCRKVLSKSEEFQSAYGTLISLTPVNKRHPKTTQGNDFEKYMDFECETIKATFKVRVYHSYATDSDRYVVDTDTVKWK